MRLSNWIILGLAVALVPLRAEADTPEQPSAYSSYISVKSAVQSGNFIEHWYRHPCNGPIASIRTRGEPNLKRLALQAAELEFNLRAFGIPEHVWRDSLTGLERRAVSLEQAYTAIEIEYGVYAEHEDRYLLGPLFQESSLAQILKDHLGIPDDVEEETIDEAQDDDLEERISRYDQITNHTEINCADGGLVAELRTIPGGAKVFLTTELDQKICEALGIDPLNTNECLWREETGSPTIVVSGRTAYKVLWPDGSVSAGIRDFDNNWVEGQVFVIRK